MPFTAPNDRRFRLRLLLGALSLVCMAWPAATARAGGGPENVFLVVNRQSESSLTIANHYIALRQIPPLNVLTLEWPPEREEASIDQFREKILTPILRAIDQRKLHDQIDEIVYSADFPSRIQLDTDFAKFKKELAEAIAARRRDAGAAEAPDAASSWPNYLTSPGSITGLTFYWLPVLKHDAGYLDLEGNAYFSLPPDPKSMPDSRAFRGADVFDAKGRVLELPATPAGDEMRLQGRHYLLSAMLGVTRGRGNTLPEVLAYLRRSAAADGTHPAGTIYFCRNSDARSTPRHALFPAAVAAIEKLGVRAEIIDGVLPQGKKDVQGLMTGVASFDWPAARSTILPGAICEHFTSYGGILESSAGQTPLSIFLRYGAAGSSGAVAEPYNLPHKFPAAAMQLHYVRGCTLAEAFYQSVWAPYQLLIVGDPLCRPWANIAEVSYRGVEPGQRVQGALQIHPTGKLPRGGEIAQFELFVDGLRVGRCDKDGALRFDTAALADGDHELRIVAIEAGPIRSQGRAIFSIATANHDRRITAKLAHPPVAGRPIEIEVDSPGSQGVVVLRGSQLLGSLGGAQGAIRVDPRRLGYGPIELRVVGLGSAATDHVFAPPIDFDLNAP